MTIKYRDKAYEDPIQRPRYTGVPTFMRAPYREDWTQLDIGLVGVPFDGGVTNRTGARHGPRERRDPSEASPHDSSHPRVSD